MKTERSYSIFQHKGFWLASFTYDGGTQGYNEPLGTFLTRRGVYLRIAWHAFRQALRAANENEQLKAELERNPSDQK